MKNGRQNEIMRLISENDIDTQEELREYLIKEGYKVTQATVSRDIRELKILKVMTGNGRYKYICRTDGDDTLQDRFSAILKQAVRTVEAAMNIVVVSVYVGMGSAVGAAIDSLRLSGIIGTVAGDDTLIMIARTPEQATSAAESIRDLISRK